MHRIALLGIAIACVAVSSRATATSDGGTSARLLALAGAGSRYAIIVEDNVQEPCGGALPCNVYHADVTSGQAKRLAATTLPGNAAGGSKSDAEVLAQYLRTVPAAQPAKLASADLLRSTQRALRYDADHSASISTQFDLGGGDGLSVAVERVWRTPSIAPWDKLSSEACIEGAAARCSSCARATSWHDDERFTTWACTGVGVIPQGGRSVPCDCTAQAELVRLRVTRSKTGNSIVGSAV